MPAAPNADYETLVRVHDGEMEVHYACARKQFDLSRAAREMQDTAWRWYCTAIQSAGFQEPACKTPRK